jgi:hypothetical protein
MYFNQLKTTTMPLKNPSSSECIFIGGPLHDQAFAVSDLADGVYIAESGQPIGAVGQVGGHPPDYQRSDEGNIFVHNSCTSDDIDAFFGDDPEEDKPDDSALIDYVTGARDFCNSILQRFASANGHPAFSLN